MACFFDSVSPHYTLTALVPHGIIMAMKNALEIYRVENGLSVAKLARLAGVRDRSAVWKHCNMESIPEAAAWLYSAALGIPLAKLRPDLPTPVVQEAGGE